MVLQLLSNGTSRELMERGGRYSPPKLNGNVYAVVKATNQITREVSWEVRCWTFRGGKFSTDELVDSFETECLADAVARFLVEGDETT